MKNRRGRGGAQTARAFIDSKNSALVCSAVNGDDREPGGSFDAASPDRGPADHVRIESASPGPAAQPAFRAAEGDRLSPSFKTD